MEQKLRELIKQAMIHKKKTGDEYYYQTYKNILEKAQKIAKDAKEDAISDNRIVEATKKELKQLEDTLSYCKPGDGHYESTSACIKIAKSMLPAQISSEEIANYLRNNTPAKNMGTCMKILKEYFGSSLDGKMASAVVKEYVSSD